MGITMSLCCCFDLNNPPNIPPKFRGHKTPLAETPIPSDDPRTNMFHAEPLLDGAPTMSCSLDSILECFEKAYDYIEMERLWRERAEESDVVEKKKPKGGPTDDYGRPVKSKYELMDAMAAKRDFLFIKQMPCRVMVWCKNGVDRSCAIVIAYLIRKFGVTLPYAENIVHSKKKGVFIDPVYMKALEEWSKKHSLGELLCDDCIAAGCAWCLHGAGNCQENLSGACRGNAGVGDALCAEGTAKTIATAPADTSISPLKKINNLARR